MKATAKAPANIAFIKYWGKADDELRIPLNSSISMNLSEAYTVTTVEFQSDFKKDAVTLLGGSFSEKETARVIQGLERIRQRVGISMYARVVTKNTFPKGVGSAASASGFAALTVAGFSAAGVKLTEKELTIFARMGSGSACRSIPDGFVVWEKGKTSEDSYAHSLYSSTYWDIRDILVIVDAHMKKVPTTEGMEGIMTSPYWQDRIAGIPAKIIAMKLALAEKNFEKFGNSIEEDALNMHHIMQTQTPPLMYWNDRTKEIMKRVYGWRKDGLPVYFSIDAGPNVHLFCEGKDINALVQKVRDIDGVQSIIINKPSIGAHCIPNHLF